MPNSKQARKRVKQDKERRVKNGAIRSEFRTHVKAFLKQVGAGDVASAEKSLATVESYVDRAAKRNVIHTGKANRLKSRLKTRLSKAKTAPAA